MSRGPLCGETNPLFVRTPGALGCNDTDDPNHTWLRIDPVGAAPLGARPKAHGRTRPKTVSEAPPARQGGQGKPPPVKNLRRPSAAVLAQLTKDLNAVKALNKK